MKIKIMDLKKYKLGDIADIINGATPSTSCEDNYDGEIVWITPKDLSEQKAKYVERGSRNITQKGFNSCSAQMIPAYNILMSSRAPIGLLAINKAECCTNQGFKNIVVDRSICDVDFLYYYLKYHIKEIEALGSGTTFKEVSKASLQQFEITIPSLDVQKHIASILADIDQKIALNRAINDNLEAMAKQLYDYWFVQFDFPNEEGKPYKSSGGKMVWNENLKREIPEGWDCMCIGDYAKCKGGYAFKSKDFTSKGTPVIKIGNIQEDYTLNMVDSQCINDFDNSLFIARKYDLVIAMTGATIGKFAISPKEYLVNQRVGRFDLGKSPLGRLGYLFNSLKQEYFREQVFQIASGCAQPNISSEQIDSIVVLKPKMSVLNNFNQLCEPILEQQVENILQIELLAKHRDELLPLLMNGQVSVNYHLSVLEVAAIIGKIHHFYSCF